MEVNLCTLDFLNLGLSEVSILLYFNTDISMSIYKFQFIILFDDVTN